MRARLHGALQVSHRPGTDTFANSGSFSQQEFPSMADQKGMAKTSTRTLWKGAITFGLVHIPIGLYSATAESDLNFDWLDRRTMDPVGYKRVNKKTGKEIDKDDIVKGIEWQDGQYVILSPEEIAAAYPRTTQTIEIEAFVDADEVPFVYLERPYYVGPVNKGDKVYALLREALKQTGKVGIAKVVIQTKQHLAVLIPCGPALILNLLRWGGEIRSWEELKLPPSDAKAAGVREAELNMAKQLIEGMTAHWSADQFRDSFKEEVMKLVEAKAEAGDTAHVDKVESQPAAPAGADVIDLTELLKRSLQRGGGGKAAAPAPAPASKKAAGKQAPAKKPAPAKARNRRAA
ncbi:Candidate KU-like protein, YkoV-like family [Ramlibacter tataouinensis TTB310]|uniref:Non-homologous end joining protein Ku n=2 Tax=Ramlibacter tataouinensis TaxID=94132 RepID=F5Y082_RAMTT|nr:Candidate KU-like protein, YkoV-like family [Ramlibacter tataouinensis TTB310]